MEFLTGVLFISIGCAVAWLLALFTARGPSLLIGDTACAIAGAAICAGAFAHLLPTLTIVGLVVLGPVCSFLAIQVGDAIRRRVPGWRW
jgi:hypothetical protein